MKNKLTRPIVHEMFFPKFLPLVLTLFFTMIPVATAEPKNEEIPFLVGSDFKERRNVAWRVELGQVDSNHIMIEPEMPWDDRNVFQHGTVLRDPIDGLWKA